MALPAASPPPIDILKLKIDQLQSVQAVGIHWWASSCVLCAGIIAGVWRNRSSLSESRLIPPLRVAIGFFFLSIVIFGFLITFHLFFMAWQVSQLTYGSGFVWDFVVTAISYVIATSSFVLATIAWSRLASTFLKAPKAKPHSKPRTT